MPSGHEALVDDLVSMGVLRTPEIVGAFRKIDRAAFVLPEYRPKAYINKPLPIGFSQTISQPYTVAFMLELLQPETGTKVLEIGTGSGWQTALLAESVGAGGKVIGLEVIPELCEMGKKNLAGFEFGDRVEIHCGNAIEGRDESAPYDRIIAAATGEAVPIVWQEQLAIGGILVAPEKTVIVKITREDQDSYTREEYPGFAFVPLV